jgi:hypothetical protein
MATAVFGEAVGPSISRLMSRFTTGCSKAWQLASMSMYCGTEAQARQFKLAARLTPC